LAKDILQIKNDPRSKAVKPLFLEIMRRRVHIKNKNVLAIYVGETGSGKSYSALRSAEILDPNFTIDNVCFSTIEFLTFLRNGIKKKTLKKGMVIIYDEIGIGHSNRNFQDAINKSLNFIFQGFRKENLIVFLTVPKMKFVDKQTRELMHYIVTPRRIDKKRSFVHCQGYTVEQNPLLFGEDMYVKRAKIAGAKFDGVQEMDTFGLALPSEHLRIQYEEKKRSFLNDLYDKALATAKAGEAEQLKRIGISKKQATDGELDADI